MNRYEISLGLLFPKKPLIRLSSKPIRKLYIEEFKSMVCLDKLQELYDRRIPRDCSFDRSFFVKVTEEKDDWRTVANDEI